MFNIAQFELIVNIVKTSQGVYAVQLSMIGDTSSQKIMLSN